MSPELQPAGFTPCERPGEDPLLRCEGPNASCLGCPTGGFTLPRGLQGKSVLSGLDARLRFSPFILCKPPFHFMSGFICAENASVIPPGFRNYIILLFLKLSFKNPCTRTHTPRGVGVGAGAWGPRGRAGERTAWLSASQRARRPLGAHSSESAGGFAAQSNLRGPDPLSAPGVGPRRPAPPLACQAEGTAAGSPGPGGSGRGRETEQVAIRSDSEHSWTAPVDINNRQAGSEKSQGAGQGSEEAGVY